MATYKSEVLYQRYRRRLRPRTHYSLGWLPRWSRMASLAPRIANRALSNPLLRVIGLRAAGVDARRSLPKLAEQPFHRWWRTQPKPQPEPGRQQVPILLDCFTNYYRRDAAEAAIRLLRSAGYDPVPTDERRCCGLTWLSTGQLDTARRVIEQTVTALAPIARQRGVIVGLEPSCAAALRHDAVELLAGSEFESDARDVAGAITTLGGFLQRENWTPPLLTGTHIVAMPHCHHHAVLGWEDDRMLLERTGADLTVIAGCCGLAGNFGVERGHYEVSVKVAQLALLPALRVAPDAVVLADGFSCRTQVADLADRPSVHIAELLDRS